MITQVRKLRAATLCKIAYRVVSHGLKFSPGRRFLGPFILALDGCKGSLRVNGGKIKFMGSPLILPTQRSKQEKDGMLLSFKVYNH